MEIIAREVFLKGNSFHFAAEAGIENRALVANATMKWLFAHKEVASLIYGTDNPNCLENALKLMDNLKMSEQESEVIAKIKQTKGFVEVERAKALEFGMYGGNT